MALSVPADRHRGLHGGQVVSDPAVHGGPLRPGVGPHRRRGFLLPAGGDRAREADQAADLGHRGSGALQVSTDGRVRKFYSCNIIIIYRNNNVFYCNNVWSSRMSVW